MKIKISPAYFLLLVFCIGGCGQIIQGTGSAVTGNIQRARKNITRAETMEDLKQKDLLLNEAYTIIQQSEQRLGKEKNRKDPGPDREVLYGYALYYFVRGDYLQSKKNIESIKAMKTFDPLSRVLEVRLLLHEKGKEGARDSIDLLNYVLKNSPEIPEAFLALGDCYNYLLDMERARQNYRKVLLLGGDLQVQAADRLEVLDEIEKIRLDPGMFQNIIFSRALRRDEVADLMGRVFGIDRMVRFPKALKEFGDISGSLYRDSIRALRAKGFYSYIGNDRFEPFKNVTRREMAGIMEDFLVLVSGREDLRKSYPKDVSSPIPDVESSDPFYNAMRIAVRDRTIELSLSGFLQPDKPLGGLEALRIIKRMIQRSAQ